ncbi:MAG: hypothetical protein ABIJ96_11105 [Elusimicrobiota bacterium]
MNTTRLISQALAAALALGAAGVPAAALETQTLCDLQVLGGQYFFQGERGALNGNASGLFASVLVLNDRWTLVPSVASRFQGTKQVVDLVGAGTLFSQQMDHRIGVKGVYRRPESDWLFKPALSYSVQLLKETLDERWFAGLFDYRMIDLGFEAEYIYRDPYSVRAGVDYVYTHFPNYTSLESQLALDFQGQPLARELVGDNVLDTHALMFSAALTVPLGRGLRAESGLSFTRQSYPQQPVVAGTGLLTGDNRADLITSFSTALDASWKAGREVRVAPRLGLAVANTVANQNNYDAMRTEHQPGYYNSTELKLEPEVRLLLGDPRQPVALRLGSSLSFRRYPHRRIQDASGTYLDETLRQNGWMFTATASYPMAPGFRLLFNLQHGKASSNQGFEQFYSYNYTATNYLIGFRYEH